ncbi:uncharacterized protein LOC132628974 [Lycium barbarum]|uniref:uncharacterized protein LOC132628974 n=1 Tax=Lycium barbarum TaxID=112863 RepID=UPI00293F1863|nr:uncharacterized protein LOC132628974 [Lycium barbarum]
MSSSSAILSANPPVRQKYVKLFGSILAVNGQTSMVVKDRNTRKDFVGERNNNKLIQNPRVNLLPQNYMKTLSQGTLLVPSRSEPNNATMHQSAAHGQDAPQPGQMNVYGKLTIEPDGFRYDLSIFTSYNYVYVLIHEFNL